MVKVRDGRDDQAHIIAVIESIDCLHGGGEIDNI